MTVMRTIIVPAAMVGPGKDLGRSLAPAGHGMFLTALSSNGLLPATHYISSGLIEDQFAGLLTDGIALFTAAQHGASQQGLTMSATQADSNSLITQSVVHDGTYTDANGNTVPEGPHELLSRLGLVIINQ